MITKQQLQELRGYTQNAATDFSRKNMLVRIDILLEAFDNSLFDPDELTLSAPKTLHEDTKPAFTLRTEATPERLVARNWQKTCKRCLEGVPDGEKIVRIYGTGWWHDRCYRIVNPKYYEGLD